MASTEAEIFRALMTRVASANVGLPIAWPNVAFAKPADGKYAEARLIPNGTARVAITSATPHRHFGLLQISVFWPLNGGEAEPRENAGRFAAHFPADLRLTSGLVTVRITKDPAVADLMPDDHGAMIPVTIDWEAFA